MKYGIGSYCTTWAIGVPGFDAPENPLSPGGLLTLAKEKQILLVQIADNMPLQNLTEPELDELATISQAHGITVELGMRGSDPDLLLRYLHIAKKLSASLVRTLLTEKDLAICKTHIQAVLPAYTAAKVTLAFENHGLHTTKMLADFIHSFHSPYVGCCLDTVNSFGSLEGPDLVVQNLAPYTVNLHLKDFIIQRHPHQMGFEIIGASLGEGRLDITGIIDKIQQEKAMVSENMPTLILENWVPWQGNIEDTVLLETAWLDKGLVRLQQLFV